MEMELWENAQPGHLPKAGPAKEPAGADGGGACASGSKDLGRNGSAAVSCVTEPTPSTKRWRQEAKPAQAWGKVNQMPRATQHKV